MNSTIIDIRFEREKNLKALGITFSICAVLFFLFLYTQWSQPQIAPPLADEGIEVNIGNSETGIGDIAPQSIGENMAESNSTPSPEELAQPIAENTIDDKGDVPIATTPITKPIIKTVTPPKEIIKPTTNPVVKPEVKPTPKPPTPKAVFSGSTTQNNSGNNSDSYNGIKNQGIAGGNGDQGNPNGNPNSDSYNGNSSSGSGINIKSGLTGRRIAIKPKFEDEFNENAKVAVDVKVDASGKVLSATVNPRGTTTTNANIRQIAKNKAMQVKFTTGAEEQSGTIVFDFRVTN